MTTFNTNIVLKQTHPSILDPIFEVAEIEVEVELECQIYGGSSGTYYQPPEYPEAELKELNVVYVELHPLKKGDNSSSLVNFLLNDKRKEEIKKFVSDYINSNWNEGRCFENQVIEKATDEYEAYMDDRDY
jgi:hypothetical protein